MDKSDEALMMAYQNGDEAALEVLVRRHADPLLGYLVRMMRNRSHAEDIFQETFIRVHKKAATFKATGRFKPWLYSIASHLAIDSLRKQRRTPTLVPLEDDREGARSPIESIPNGKPDPADEAGRADLAARVRSAIDILPPRQRVTLILAYYEGLTYSEVAKTLKCSVGTVKTQMSRALKKLAHVLPGPETAHAQGGAA